MARGAAEALHEALAEAARLEASGADQDSTFAPRQADTQTARLPPFRLQFTADYSVRQSKRGDGAYVLLLR
jgi:fermentation-respiration switch protein FrsA (DUF1100 family)